jgi:hypothetical protein
MGNVASVSRKIKPEIPTAVDDPLEKAAWKLKLSYADPQAAHDAINTVLRQAGAGAKKVKEVDAAHSDAVLYELRLAWAQHLAEQTPIHPIRDGTKDEPLTTHGVLDATQDKTKIAAWVQRRPAGFQQLLSAHAHGLAPAQPRVRERRPQPIGRVPSQFGP